jgi:hypothetical protein
MQLHAIVAVAVVAATLAQTAYSQIVIEAVSSFIGCIVTAPPASQGSAPFTGPSACTLSQNFSSIIITAGANTGAGLTLEVNLADPTVTASDTSALGINRVRYESANLTFVVSPVLVSYALQRSIPAPNKYYSQLIGGDGDSCDAYDKANRDYRANAIFTDTYVPSNWSYQTRTWRAVCDRPPQFGLACFAGCMSGICQGAYHLQPYSQISNNPSWGGGTTMPQCTGGGYLYSSNPPFAPPYEAAMTPAILPCVNTGPDRDPNDPNGVILDAFGGGSNCNNLFCAICLQKLGPGARLGRFTGGGMIWTYPIWRTFTLNPAANYVYNVTLTIAREGAPVQHIEVGQITEDNGQTEIVISQESADGTVRLDLLGQQRFGVVPAQDGVIFALDDQWRAGYVQLLAGENLFQNQNLPPGCFQTPLMQQVPGNLQCNASRPTTPVQPCPPLTAATQPTVYQHIARPGTFGIGYEEGAQNPRAPGAGPPQTWGWCRQGELGCNFGPNCNQVGISNDYYQQGENADIVCFSGLGNTCIPGEDYWSPGSGAYLPPEMIALNNAAYAANPQLRVPYAPDFLQYDDGVQRTWLNNGSLWWKPPQSVGVNVRFRILIDGSLVRFLEVLPTGTLEYVDVNGTAVPASQSPICNVVVGEISTIHVAACNNDTVGGTYAVVLDCSAATDLVIEGPQNIDVGLNPGECTVIEYAVQASGAFVQATQQCAIYLFDAEEDLLAQLPISCNQSLPFSPTLPPSVYDAVNSVAAATQPFPEWAQILLAVLAVVAVLALLAWTAWFIRSTYMLGLRRRVARSEAALRTTAERTQLERTADAEIRTTRAYRSQLSPDAYLPHSAY